MQSSQCIPLTGHYQSLYLLLQLSLQQLPAWIVAFRAVHAMVVWSDQGFAIRPKKKWPINAVRGLSFSARLSANACPMAHGQAQYRNAVIFHIFIWQQYSVLSDLSTSFFSGMVNFCSTQIYNVGKCTTFLPTLDFYVFIQSLTMVG